MKRIQRVLLIVLVLALPARLRAGDSTVVNSTPVSADGFTVKPGPGGRKIASTVAVGGLLLTSLIWSYDTWWRDSGRPFHFFSENWLDGPFLGIDKLGHFYTSYFYFHTFRNVMLWGGYEASTATFWAAASAGFFALAIEVGDGVTPQYGFDYQDMVFNFAGIGFGLLQTKIPYLRHFNIKWSYIPNQGYRLPVRFTDLYGAHTYWITADINSLLPETLEPYWPDFLQVGVGMSVNEPITKREFVIGFDLNLESLFRPENEDWLLLTRTVDMFHVPGPALKLTEDGEPVWYLFHRN